MVKADLARTPLKIEDVDFVNTGMLGEVNLPPTILLSKPPDSFAQFDAYIRVHPSSIDLVETLFSGCTLCRKPQKKRR